MNDLKKKNDFEQRFSDDLLHQLDHLIGKYDWRKTKLLQLMLKELNARREAVLSIREGLLVKEKKRYGSYDHGFFMSSIDSEKEMVVFVTLYQSQGKELKVWEHLLSSLVSTSINRPVYVDERAARRAIADREHLLGEGYAAVKIKKTDALPADAITASVDRLGQRLFGLQLGVLRPENILFFVHANKQRYYYDARKKKLKKNIEK